MKENKDGTNINNKQPKRDGSKKSKINLFLLKFFVSLLYIFAFSYNIFYNIEYKHF